MSDNQKITIITPKVENTLGIRESLKNLELLWMLSHRQIASRYRQMLLGFIWALFEPLGQLLLLTFIFGYLLKIDTGGYPYPLYAFSGLVSWFLFSRATVASAGSLLDNMDLITKVYFPRLLLPIAAVAKEVFDNAVMLVILIVIAIISGYEVSANILFLPLILLNVALLATGLGLWLAVLIVKFRDIRPMLNLVLQAGMYATPIIYNASLIPENIRFIYQINPMYWAVESTRWILLDKPLEINGAFYVSMIFSVIIIVGGLSVFSLYEGRAVDVK